MWKIQVYQKGTGHPPGLALKFCPWRQSTMESIIYWGRMMAKLSVQLYKDLIAHDNSPGARTPWAVHAGHLGLACRSSTVLLRCIVWKRKVLNSQTLWWMILRRLCQHLTLVSCHLQLIFICDLRRHLEKQPLQVWTQTALRIYTAVWVPLLETCWSLHWAATGVI